MKDYLFIYLAQKSPNFQNHSVDYCQATQTDGRAILGESFAVGTIENPSQGYKDHHPKVFGKMPYAMYIEYKSSF